MEPGSTGSLPTKNKQGEEIGIEITFYTDPLCCWSWAMQPQWQQLKVEMQLPSSHLKYKMGGLLPSWSHFDDNINSIRKPVQMGPEWMHAKVLSHRPINDKIWATDPPASSFPACIAVKCAELQSPQIAEQYLNKLQEAVMVRNENIARTKVLLESASNLTSAYPSFDLVRFRQDLLGETGKAAFRKDLQECKYLNITRLPTLLFKSSTNRSVLLTGYQSFESLQNAWQKVQ